MSDSRLNYMFKLAKKNPRFQFSLLSGAILIFLKSYFLGCSIRARKHFESSSLHSSSLLLDILHMSVFKLTAEIFNIVFSLLKAFCRFEVESFVSGELFLNSQKTDLKAFLKLSSEEHFSLFAIKRNAFTKFSVLMLFSIPQNVFSIFYESYQIVFCSEKFRCYAFFSILFLMAIYICTVHRAITERTSLRSIYNQSRIEKNRVCREILDTFETVKADLGEEKVLQNFNVNLRMEFSRSLTYFVASEYYRLITRFSVLALKIFLIFLRLLDFQHFDLRQIIMRINVMNTSLLELRNNLFMLLEYWSEAYVEQPPQVKKECEFSLAESIQAECLRTNNEQGANAAKRLKRANCKTLSNNQICKNEYPSDSNSLKCSEILAENRLSFSIPARSKTLIIGSSSMDKNMVLKMLTCQKSYLGSLKIGKTEVSKIQDDSIYKKTTYLPETQLVFNKSIAYNILYGTTITLQSAIRRLKSLQLFDYFRQFENGFDTIVGNKVYGLSNGQVQMICFCRCILRDCDLYLFEEPSIFLDYESESAVYRAIQMLENKTVIVSTKFAKNTRYFGQILKLQ